jgi:hypothetical protein
MAQKLMAAPVRNKSDRARKPRAAAHVGPSQALVAAARADTQENLLAFQRTLKNALIRPLAPGDRTQKKWVDGRSMAEFAETFVKTKGPLTALERFQIYNRMYWFRLIECFHDDNPGLRAALGARRFSKLTQAYLAEQPSRSYTLRNLCSRLEMFLRSQPEWTTPLTALAVDIARFEWAQTVAFDEPGRVILTAADIGATPPSRLRLGLQPYLTLLALRYPVDDYVITIKKRDSLRSEASNATTSSRQGSVVRRVPHPARERIYLAVHRVENRLYYKRLAPGAFKVLIALQQGQPITRAIGAAGRSAKPDEVGGWFATWMQLGWFCRR